MKTPPLSFLTQENPEYYLIHYTIVEPGIIRPSQLAFSVSLCPMGLDKSKGIVISGRGPMWLRESIAHKYHPHNWIASYDPRKGGAVVSVSHDQKYPIGKLLQIKIDRPTK